MNRPTRPARTRLRTSWALLVVTAAALALGGCGRKGGLDLPPQAANTQPVGTATPGQAAATPTNDNSAAGKSGSIFAPTNQSEEAQAARGRKRPFLLDPVLD